MNNNNFAFQMYRQISFQ